MLGRLLAASAAFMIMLPSVVLASPIYSTLTDIEELSWENFWTIVRMFT